MSVSVQWKGIKETDRAIRAVPGLTRKGAERALEATGLLVQNDAKQRVLKGPKTGRIYQKYNPRRTHQASAPDESPASDTGTLVRNIIYDFRKAALEVFIIAGTKYAKALEYGTRDIGGFIDQRPFLRPALTERIDQIVKLFIAYSREELRRG